MRRTGLICMVLAAGTFAAVRAQEFRAANGVVVPAPEIEELDCGEMEATLGTIDSSNYRGIAPVPEGHPDRDLFNYESELSRQNYDRCIQPETVLQDAAEAFRHGFTDAVPAEPALADIPAAAGAAADTGIAEPALMEGEVPAAAPPPSD